MATKKKAAKAAKKTTTSKGKVTAQKTPAKKKRISVSFKKPDIKGYGVVSDVSGGPGGGGA